MFPVSTLEDLLCVVTNYHAHRRSLGEDRPDLDRLANELRTTLDTFRMGWKNHPVEGTREHAA